MLIYNILKIIQFEVWILEIEKMKEHIFTGCVVVIL